MPTPSIININFGQLSFNAGTAQLGDGTHVGDVVLYSNVYGTAGSGVDAIIRTISIDPKVTFNAYDSTDTSDGNQASGGLYFSPRFDGSTNAGTAAAGAGTVFQVDFIASGSYNASSHQGTAVTLQNLRENTYDIDIQQFQQFQNFSVGRLNTGGSITYAYDSATGLIDFHSNTNTNATSGDARYTIQVDYDAASSVTFMVGSNDWSQVTGLAYFYIDFGPGKITTFDTTVSAAAAGAPVGDISGTAFHDRNANGLTNSGEPGLAGITVTLLDSAGNPTGQTTTTDANGAYSFTGLAAGSYQVQFDAPGYNLLPPASAVVVAGEPTSGVDASLYQPASVSGRVFADGDNNGIRANTEAGLAGIAVTLLDSAGNPTGTTTTDSNGAYSFTGLVPGSYQVQVATTGYSISPMLAGSDPTLDSNLNPETGTASVTLVSGQALLAIDAALYQAPNGASTGTVSGMAFVDSNADGIRDPGDAPLAGITVTLLDSAGNPTGQTTTTDANGSYHFDAAPGSYQLSFGATGYVASPLHAGSNPARDSDLNALTGTAAVTIAAGQTSSAVDAGLFQNATITGTAFLDSNADGIQDGGEAGLAEITVNLLDTSGNATEFTTTTALDGSYSFQGVPPGSYQVAFVTTGYVASPLHAGSNPALDSDIDADGIALVTVTSGQQTTQTGAGLALPAPPPPPPPPAATAHISGTAYAAEPSGLCADKLSSAVFSNITVTLLDSTGAVVATTTTDASGAYSFAAAPGSYSVHFAPPADLGFLPQAGTVDPSTGTTTSITLATGDSVTQMDATLFHLSGGLADQPAITLPGGGSFNGPQPAMLLQASGDAIVNQPGSGSIILGGAGALMVNGPNEGGIIALGGTSWAELHGGNSGGAVLMTGAGGGNMEGTTGNDILIAGCTAASMQGLGSAGGTPGWLAGLGGDLLLGGDGNDTLEANGSTATLSGGAGDDRLHTDGAGSVLAGGTNSGTLAYANGQFSGLRVGDTLNASGANSTIVYQAGDGVQWLENFNAARGDQLEIWGFAAATATGVVNGAGVLYFGPNQAVLLNNWQPQNGPLAGLVFHPEGLVVPGALADLEPLPPTILAAGLTSFTGTQGDDIAVGTNAATSFTAGAGHDLLVGGDGADTFTAGTSGGSTMLGNAGADSFHGGTGTDSMDGGSSTDLVTYDFASTAATLHQLADGRWEVLKPNGLVDLLVNVETVSFTDTTISLAAAASAPLPPAPPAPPAPPVPPPPANAAPVALADTLPATAASATTLGNVLANDQDPNAGDILLVAGFHIEGRDYLPGQTATLASGAQFRIAADGTVTLVQNHGFDSLAPGATDSLVFSYTVQDSGGLTAIGDASIELTGLPAAATTTSGNGAGITGTAGADTITASGWNDSIQAGDGNDVIVASQGQSSIDAGQGNNTITAAGWNDSILAADGDNILSGTAGQAVVQFGNGAQTISLGGNGNHVTMGNTTPGHVSTILAGEGQASILAGNGNLHVVLGGHANTVQAGAGDHTVEGALGGSSVHLGAGNNTVALQGYGNVVETGAGIATIHAGQGNAMVVAGPGQAEIWLEGWSNMVDAHLGGDITVHGGAGNNLYIAPPGGAGVEHILNFNLDAGDHLRFTGITAANLSVQLSGNDLHVLANGVVVVDLVGLAALGSSSLANHGSFLFG